MEAELVTIFLRLRDTSEAILLLLPAVGVGLVALKGLGLDRWRLW